MIKNFKVYKHTSPSNKVYIGITSQDTKQRWNNGKGYKHNKYFTRAIQNYGWDNFSHEVLFDNLTEEEAKLMEQCYIALYDSFNKEKGYNQTLGGEGTLKRTGIGKVVTRRYPIYESVLKEFDEYCEKSSSCQIDLVSQAIKEFLEKYK